MSTVPPALHQARISCTQALLQVPARKVKDRLQSRLSRRAFFSCERAELYKTLSQGQTLSHSP